MARPLWVIVGVAVAVVGLVWTLQGFDVLKGSSMTGTTTWSIVGPIVLVAGLALAYVGLRRRRS
jgi:amino acid transporter